MSSNSHAETTTLKVGDTAPDFTLRTENREKWQLSDCRLTHKLALAQIW